MKFTDGYWQVQPGVEILRPRDIDEVVRQGDALLAYAPTAPIETRGDTLNRPLITVRVDSPMDDVVGVRIAHYLGGIDRGPEFALTPSQDEVAIEIPEVLGSGPATRTAGRLTARLATDGPWGWSSWTRAAAC